MEAYIQQLSNSLGTDVEKVNVGMVSMEKHVTKDAVVRLVLAIITLGVRRRASDIHVEPDEDSLHIRQRIDGVMTEMCRLPRSLASTVVSALKVQGVMNIAEKRLPQDGKFQIRVDKTDIDVRVASSPTGVGEKVSLRILDVRSIQMETKHLGMPPQMQSTFDTVIHQPHGMMLITGPTGSGKSTTVYVALQTLKSGEKNIISIEDPIEFRIPGVNQIQVNTAAGLSFASGLRSILRQDPDIIVIGEIRDKETAEIAVNSSTTGHMVFSTLHTVDAASSVARLIELGVSPRQFADALSLIVAQRLARLVCQYCKQPSFPDDAALRELGLNRVLVDGFDFETGKGCEVCNSTGYYRRTGIFEFLSPSERMRSALEAGGLSTSQIRDIAVQGGMRTLRQEAIVLMQQGMTTIEETIRVTK
ncbi:MAG: GspE/PulE family protein [Candidatus Sumerlaeota bacterium]